MAQNGASEPSYRIGLQYAIIDSQVSGSIVFDGRSSFPNKIGVLNAKPVAEPTTGARTVDNGYVAGSANVASILAGYDNVNNALAGQIASQHGMLYYGADHTSIWGGSLNTIMSDTAYSVCVGGSNNTIQPRGRYAAIIAGDQCTIETAATDDASGFRSFIASSTLCVAGGRNAVIIGSRSCRIDSNYGVILAGESITLTNADHGVAAGNNITMGANSSAAYSAAFGNSLVIDGSRSLVIGDGHTNSSGHDYAVMTGYRCISPFAGARVHSSRQRGGTAGNNMLLDWVASNETTDTTTTRLSVYGSSTYPVQPADSIIHGTVWVTGVSSTGVCSTYKIDVTSERVGAGTPTLRANSTTTIYNGLSIVTAPTFNATAGGIYRVQVVGLAGTNIRWTARFTGSQTVFT